MSERCWRRLPRAVGLVLQLGLVLGALAYVRVGDAQPRMGTPVCIPGMPMCASADGRGGIQISGSGTGQITPAGANASAQGNAGATGDGRTNANAAVTANGAASGGGIGNGQGQGSAGGSGGGIAGGSAGAGGSGSGSAVGNGNGRGSGSAGGHVTGSHPRTPSSHGGGAPRYRSYDGRFGVGVTGCPIVRVGVWSGIKAGGFIAVSFRFEGLTFEMETQLLYGGTTHAFDWTFPLSFIIPLANERSLFEGGYLRFGGSPVGATFARKLDGGSFVRFGLFAGAGYELQISDIVSWRVIDARLSFDMGTRRAMDSGGRWVDLGLQLGTGLVL